MNNKKWLLAVLVLGSFSVNALGPRTLTPVDATYTPFSKQQYVNYNGYIPEAIYVGQEYFPNYQSYVCTGLSKIPGKLVNGYCYYPNHGDENKQSSYFMLIDNGYSWKRASNMNEGDEAITSRALDSGDYVYHCYYEDLPSLPSNGDNSVYPGKYIPATGACYYANGGGEYKRNDASTFYILVP